MSEQLAKFFVSKGLNVSKTAREYVRINCEEVNEGVLKNTIELAKDFNIDKKRSHAYSISNQLFIYLKPEPIPVLEPKTLVEIVTPEAIRVEIPIPEVDTSEKIKDIIEDLEEIVDDLED